MLKSLPIFLLAALAAGTLDGAEPEHPQSLPRVQVLFPGSQGDEAIRHFLHPEGGQPRDATVFGRRRLEDFAGSLGFRVRHHVTDIPSRAQKPKVVLVGPPKEGLTAAQGRELAMGLAGCGADLIVHPDAAPWFGAAVYPTARFLTGANASASRPEPGRLTIGIPPGGALLFRRSEIANPGLSPVTLHLAANSHRGKETVTLKRNASHDYLLLTRAARERASDHPYPPEKPGEPVLENGALVLCGGGNSPRSALKWMLARAGGQEKARLVIVPTARRDEKLEVEDVIASFREIGFKNISVAHARRDQGRESSVSRAIDRANAVWFTGGRQWRLVDAYENGPALPALRRLLARGGVIGGSSAGATICGDYMVRGDPRSSSIMIAEGYERAFCFLPGVAIDQHFAQRKRFKDLEGLIHRYPQFLGLGIDEETAILVEGSTFTVRGFGKVAVYDRNPSDVPAGEALFRRLGAYQRFDLLRRKPL